MEQIDIFTIVIFQIHEQDILSFISVQFSHSVVSNSLWPHWLQHTRPPCPSSTPRAYWNSCPSNQWCHLTISSSVVPFSSFFQSFPASGFFPMNWLFASSSQTIGVSASASVLAVSIQGWFFRIDWFDLLAVQGTLKNLPQHHSSKASIFSHSAFFICIEIVVFLINYCVRILVNKLIPIFLSSRKIHSPCFLNEVSMH